MNFAEIRRQLVLAVIFLTLGLLLSASAAHRVPQAQPQNEPQTGANEVVLTFDAAQSKVHWTLGTTLHTVHGTFALKRGTVRLDPESGKVNGEIVVDAASGESGNESRDKRTHKEIIESARYPEVVFRPDRVEGKIPAQGSTTVQIHGTLLLHGSGHELSVPVQAELAAGRWKGTAKFSVPYIQWGLKNPSNFFLKVDSFVSIDLQIAGDLRSPRAP